MLTFFKTSEVGLYNQERNTKRFLKNGKVVYNKKTTTIENMSRREVLDLLSRTQLDVLSLFSYIYRTTITGLTRAEVFVNCMK